MWTTGTDDSTRENDIIFPGKNYIWLTIILNPELPHKMHEGLWLWINFLGIKCIQLIKLLYIIQKQDPCLGLTTFYTCSYAYGSHKRTPLFFFHHQKHLVVGGGGWGCPIKAAIETKHKALNSEQLNGPTIIAVGVLVWSLSLRKQEASRGGPWLGAGPLSSCLALAKPKVGTQRASN